MQAMTLNQPTRRSMSTSRGRVATIAPWTLIACHVPSKAFGAYGAPRLPDPPT